MYLEIQRSTKKTILLLKHAKWIHIEAKSSDIVSHFWFLEPLIKCSEYEILLCVTWQNTPRFVEYFAGGITVCARVFSQPPSWKQSRPWERGWWLTQYDGASLQIWWTAAGYGELCVWFQPITNGETFWMNNKKKKTIFNTAKGTVRKGSWAWKRSKWHGIQAP